MGLFYLLYEPIKKFAEQTANIQKGIVAAERMFSMINLRSHIVCHPLTVDLQGFKKSLEFKNLWFRYEQNWILQDLSFVVNKGETVNLSLNYLKEMEKIFSGGQQQQRLVIARALIKMRPS